MRNQQKTQGGMASSLATYQGPKPGDFPLGSTESRAAARALLNEKRRLSPYDEDCLSIIESTVWLTAGTCPNWHSVEPTPFYKRGRELKDMLYGPIIPYYLDAKAHRDTFASIDFECIHGREPVVGDVLRYEDIEKAFPAKLYRDVFQDYESAWKRRLPELTFPFRFEHGKLFRRVRNDDQSITWEEDTHIQPRWKWYSIEAEALGGWEHAPEPSLPPAIPAVVFVESQNRKHAIKPLGTATN